MYSTRGRPRKLTDAQVEAIMEWHRNHKPLRQFAREMGLSKSIISHVIRCKGQYKQPSPEKLDLVRSQRQRRLDKLREEGWL